MSDNIKAIRPRPEPLPILPQDWIPNKTFSPNLNDLVMEIHKKLIENPKYVAFLDAVYDEDCVEGSQATDNTMAAQMIREYAAHAGIQFVASKKLHPIVIALGTVLRRYGFSRKQRRQTVAGQVVVDGNHNSEE